MTTTNRQPCRACERAADVKAALLVPGATVRGVAKAFSIPSSTLDRHLKGHVPQEPAKPSTARSRAAGAVEAIAQASAAPTRHEKAQRAVKALAATPPAPRQELEAGPPPACSICASSAHFAIGVAVRQGATYATIATRHGVDIEELRRHALGCIPDLLAQAGDLAARTSPSVVLGASGGVMGKAERLVEQAQDLVSDAVADPDPRRRAAAITATVRAVELLAKMRGELEANLARRLMESEDWTLLRDRILDALAPHHEALAAVVAAIGRGSA